MKKLIGIIIIISLLSGTLASCEPAEKSDEKVSVVTTVFAEYDWVNQILGETGENAEVTLLLDNGADLHNFQPTADDIITVATCDIFIYVGGESDAWVDDVLAQSQNKDMTVINLFDVLKDSLKDEETVDGLEHDGNEEHCDEENGECAEKDEHVWLSLKNAIIACKAIGEALCKVDSEHAENYTENVEIYCEKLKALDAEYKSAVDASSLKTLLFADRFPFRYMTDDYGIEYYAAFSDCSAESDASFETVAFLAGKIDEFGLSSVITLKGSDADIAKTVIETSSKKNTEILVLDSMQTTTSKDAENGTTYLSVMENNLEVLKNALK